MRRKAVQIATGVLAAIGLCATSAQAQGYSVYEHDACAMGRAGAGVASPCVGGAVRSLKIRGELTIAARSGCASGTLMTSIRNRADLGSSIGPLRHPGSSVGERTPADPET